MDSLLQKYSWIDFFIAYGMICIIYYVALVYKIAIKNKTKNKGLPASSQSIANTAVTIPNIFIPVPDMFEQVRLTAEEIKSNEPVLEEKQQKEKVSISNIPSIAFTEFSINEDILDLIGQSDKTQGETSPNAIPEDHSSRGSFFETMPTEIVETKTQRSRKKKPASSKDSIA